MEHIRRAALSLHGMHAQDRDWLLGQLTESQRTPLVSMLDELEELKIPREPVLLEAVNPAPVPDDTPVHPLVGRLLNCKLEKLRDVLADEPDAVTSGLINGANWPWREELIQAMPPARREAICAPGGESEGLTRRAFEALCQSVLRVLESPTPDETDVDATAIPRPRRLLEKLPWRR